MALDPRTASLIAVGASISANCQPCLEGNVTRTLKHGADPQDVADAIDVGKKVRQGAASKMDALATSLNVLALDAATPGSEKRGCCS